MSDESSLMQDESTLQEFTTALSDMQSTIRAANSIKMERSGIVQWENSRKHQSPGSFRTPRRLGDRSVGYDSPEPSPIPDIVLIPPSNDRKRVRNSRTPSKTKKILMSFSNAKVFSTPLNTVGEETREESSSSIFKSFGNYNCRLISTGITTHLLLIIMLYR